MSPTGSERDHRTDLEESFFARSHPELRDRLREAEHTRTRQMEALAEVSGIEDVGVLEKLVLQGIGRDTLAALTLYPLVAVAWADGSVDVHERRAVLRAAEQCGITRDSASYQLLSDWLVHAPDALLLTAWKGFVTELCHHLGSDFRASLEREILSRARAVANASGGFLALDKTSSDEQRVLEELMQAFAAAAT